MIDSRLILPFITVTAYAFAEPDTASRLLFTNGDSIAGNLVSLDKDQLRWTSDTLGGQANLQISKIREISFTGDSEIKSDGDHIAFVQFNPDLRQQNKKIAGDTIYGSLIDISETHLVLDTWYAGQLKLDRNMIKSFEINHNSPSLYSGPKSENDWTIKPSKSWENSQNTLIAKSSGTATHEFDNLPEAFCLSFSAAWKNRFNLQITFCSKSSRNEGYLLTIDQNYTYLQRYSSNQGSRMIQGNNGEDRFRFSESEQGDFELFVDRSRGTIALFCDKKAIQEWKDNDKKAEGKTIAFTKNSDDTVELNLSKIRITNWNGKLPNQSFANPNPITNPDPAKGQQRIYLRNGDIALGSFKKIDNGQISISSTFGDLKLPVSRIKMMDIPPPEYNERILQNGDVRCWFPDGKYITFRLLEVLKDGKYKGTSQHFGEAIFDPKAFSRVEFNLYPILIKNL